MGGDRPAGAVRDVRPARRLRCARSTSIVAGINPGANVGRSVYHSGTVGRRAHGPQRRASAASPSARAVDRLRRRGPGLGRDAVEPAVGHARPRSPRRWSAALVADLPAEPVVVNLNVPNVPLEEIKGWRSTRVGMLPPRSMSSAVLEPKLGHEDCYDVKMSWGEAIEPAPRHRRRRGRERRGVDHLPRAASSPRSPPSPRSRPRPWTQLLDR